MLVDTGVLTELDALVAFAKSIFIVFRSTNLSSYGIIDEIRVGDYHCLFIILLLFLFLFLK